jgi:hypothetical protein
MSSAHVAVCAYAHMACLHAIQLHADYYMHYGTWCMCMALCSVHAAGMHHACVMHVECMLFYVFTVNDIQFYYISSGGRTLLPNLQYSEKVFILTPESA